MLARCPAIVRAYETVLHGEPSDSACEALIKEAISLLESRCLVFRLTPYEGGTEPRFAIHRRLQRNILERLGAPFVEFQEIDQFTMTMYATQPNELPKLSPESHSLLREVVSALSGNPDALELSELYFSASASPAIRRQMLRAALGILRSVYSIATLGRLHGEQKKPALRPGLHNQKIERGYFEEHRLLILWLIRQANKLQGPVDRSGAIAECPFYREEVVWLINECGTLSLMQGRLADATALLEMAQTAASEIETEESGAIRTCIGLNQAAVQIERGRFQTARQRLVSIANTRDEHPVIPLIANGYLGLIEHLTGKLDRARHFYRHALDGPKYRLPEGLEPGLVKLGRSRAASIFFKHQADLLRLEGDQRAAELMITQATNLAREGGHEDVCHSALLGKIRIELEDTRRTNLHSVFAQLEELSAYGHAVGMPRSICEVEALRCRALQAVGDLKGSCEAAFKSMEVATLHELRLRKATAAIAIAEICVLRKLYQVSDPLIEAALEIARDTEYHDALSRAQRLLRGMPGSFDPPS